MRGHGKQVKMNLSSGARNDSQVVSRFSCIDSRGRSLSVWPEESRGTREKLFDLGHGHSMGGDFEPWRLGAWAAPHETIPSHCVWVLMCDSTKTENGCGACRRPWHMGDFVYVSGPAGCEHTDDHGSRGWGTRKHFKAHGRFVAHRSKRMHGELVSLCWCERLWVACILRCISNWLLGVLDVRAHRRSQGDGMGDSQTFQGA